MSSKNDNELPVAFPLFLKPLDAANGNGIDDLSFVTNFKEYKSKIVRRRFHAEMQRISKMIRSR